MNAEKAREYFSQYYEGELKGGLLEQFERVLNQDAQVQAEYRAFAQTMEQLQILSEPIAEPNFDLHERISQRLDRHWYETERNAKPAFWQRFGKLAFGTIAAVAILGAGASIFMRNSGVQQASPVPPIGAPVKPAKRAAIDSSKISISKTDQSWSLTYETKESVSLSILDEDRNEVQSADLHGNAVNCPLTNFGPTATVLELQFSTAENPLYVAVPGTESGKKLSDDTGDIKDLARAAAEAYGRPVIFVKKASEQYVKWSFKPDQAVESIAAALTNQNYTADEDSSGAIWIR